MNKKIFLITIFSVFTTTIISTSEIVKIQPLELINTNNFIEVESDSEIIKSSKILNNMLQDIGILDVPIPLESVSETAFNTYQDFINSMHNTEEQQAIFDSIEDNTTFVEVFSGINYLNLRDNYPEDADMSIREQFWQAIMPRLFEYYEQFADDEGNLSELKIHPALSLSEKFVDERFLGQFKKYLFIQNENLENLKNNFGWKTLEKYKNGKYAYLTLQYIMYNHKKELTIMSEAGHLYISPSYHSIIKDYKIIIDENFFINNFDTDNISELHISNLNIATLPKSIDNLINLTHLEIHRTQLEKLPESIGNLIELLILDLKFNQLKKLSKSIENLTKLKILRLKNNNLETLPESIGNLIELSILNLANNKLKKLPKSIKNLTNLETLILWENKLKTIPESIGNLAKLNYLYLSHNHLKKIPKSIGNLTQLRVFRLQDNYINTETQEFKQIMQALEQHESLNYIQYEPQKMKLTLTIKEKIIPGGIYSITKKLSYFPQEIIKMRKFLNSAINAHRSPKHLTIIQKFEIHDALNQIKKAKKYLNYNTPKEFKNIIKPIRKALSSIDYFKHFETSNSSKLKQIATNLEKEFEEGGIVYENKFDQFNSLKEFFEDYLDYIEQDLETLK